MAFSRPSVKTADSDGHRALITASSTATHDDTEIDIAIAPCHWPVIVRAFEIQKVYIFLGGYIYE